jgi:hypothetical protein
MTRAKTVITVQTTLPCGCTAVRSLSTLDGVDSVPFALATAADLAAVWFDPRCEKHSEVPCAA